MINLPERGQKIIRKKMKKLSFMIVAAGLVATPTLTSCKKEKVIPETKSSSNNTLLLKTAQEEEDYYDDMIRTVSYGIADLSTNVVFRQTVADLVALQFDGDDNIPMIILDSALAANGINLKQEMASSLTTHNKQSLLPHVTAAVDGFEYFGDTLYTQIYIPFIVGKNIVTTTPTICMNFEDKPILTSFKKEGSVLLNGTTDEAFATNNNVFVVSVNETIGNGKPKLGGGSGSSGSMLKATAAGDRILLIRDVNISDKKEGWGNGRADISFQSICFRPSCNRQDYKLGDPFGKIANGELGTWFTPFRGNKAIADGLPDYWEESKNEEVKIVFYEKDLRNKFKKTISLFSCPGGNVDVISKEEIYGIVQPTFAEYNSYTYTDIVFNLTGGSFKLRGTKF